jgi:hypothetical protein
VLQELQLLTGVRLPAILYEPQPATATMPRIFIGRVLCGLNAI